MKEKHNTPIHETIDLKLAEAKAKVKELEKQKELEELSAEIETSAVYAYYRISTTNQKDGSGIDRQDANIEAYVKRHQLRIDHYLEDIGLSGYHGKNLTGKGQLGLFIRKIKHGIIKSPTLIVDSIDRVGRLPINEAINLFTTLMGDDVTIITASDGKKYNSQDDDGIFFLTMLAKAANHESKEKSRRSKGAWTRELKRAQENKEYVMHIPHPFWIERKTIKGRESLVLIPEKVKLLKEIFRRTNQGESAHSIAASFNQRGIPPITKARSDKRHDTWYQVGISFMIRNPAIYGDYVSHDRGVSIKGYYPPVVSKQTWSKANTTIGAKKTREPKRNDGRPYSIFLPVFIDDIRASFICSAKYNTKRELVGSYSYYKQTLKTGKIKLSVSCEKLEAAVWKALLNYNNPTYKLFKHTDPVKARLLSRLQTLEVNIGAINDLGNVDGDKISVEMIKRLNEFYLEKEELEQRIQDEFPSDEEKQVTFTMQNVFLKKLKKTPLDDRNALSKISKNTIERVEVEGKTLKKIHLRNGDMIHLDSNLI